MHTVHGTFKLKSGAVKFDPKSGDAAGEIVVDATSGESGDQGRDSDMHKKVLESSRYPEITFLPKRVIGSLAEQGKSNLQVQGVFKIHGAEHDFTLPMTIEKNGSAITASSSFVVPYQDWGMKNPSKMFLHVDSKVDVSVTATGRRQQLATSNQLSAVSSQPSAFGRTVYQSVLFLHVLSYPLSINHWPLVSHPLPHA